MSGSAASIDAASHRLRSLAPANVTNRPAATEDLTRQESAGSSRANTLIPAACAQCRKRKVKCTGARPSCAHCARHRLQCSYTTQPGETEAQALSRRYRDLQIRTTALEELMKLLKTLPEPVAQSVLQRIRSHEDIETIINHVKAGDLLLQMAVVPETRLRYQLPYKSDMPAAYLPDNLYLKAKLFEGDVLGPQSPPAGFKKARKTQKLPEIQLDAASCLFLRPFHAATVVDPLITNARFSPWTKVCDDDPLMLELLKIFLRCEYQFTAIFHKDLFLEDLAAHREDFCSSLLVNVVLGYACVCYSGFNNRAEYWNPQTLCYRFMAEAKRLWELGANEPRITTIQAGILFNVFYNLSGLDEVGQAYRIQSLALAHRLRLFDGSPHEDESQRHRKGKAFTAWALYNWETLVGFSFVFAPLLTTPPTWTLPDPEKDPAWYGEIWLSYPMVDRPISSQFAPMFKARSDLRIIMNEYCVAAHTKESNVTLAYARHLWLRLDRWYTSLPDLLQPQRIALPAQLQLHMYYYHLLLAIFEPFRQTVNNPPSQPVPPPQDIITSAHRYLQTLIRLYYLRHGYEAMDLFIVIPLMLTGSDAIDSINALPEPPRPAHLYHPSPELETLRSTLILVAKGLYEQKRNHYLAEALFRVIRGRMRPAEVALLRGMLSGLDDEGGVERDMPQNVRSHWPVSIVKRGENMEGLVLKYLVENYAHLNLDDERIVDEVEDGADNRSGMGKAEGMEGDEAAGPVGASSMIAAVAKEASDS